MGISLACMVGAVVGYIVGVIIERRSGSIKKSNHFRAHPGVRQQLARKSKPPRFRKW